MRSLTPAQLNALQDEESEFTSARLAAATPLLMELALLQLANCDEKAHAALLKLLGPIVAIVEAKRLLDPRARRSEDTQELVSTLEFMDILIQSLDESEFHIPTWRCISNSSLTMASKPSTVVGKIWPVLCVGRGDSKTLVPLLKGIPRLLSLLIPSQTSLISASQASLSSEASSSFAAGFASRFTLEVIRLHWSFSETFVPSVNQVFASAGFGWRTPLPNPAVLQAITDSVRKLALDRTANLDTVKDELPGQSTNSLSSSCVNIPVGPLPTLPLPSLPVFIPLPSASSAAPSLSIPSLPAPSVVIVSPIPDGVTAAKQVVQTSISDFFRKEVISEEAAVAQAAVIKAERTAAWVSRAEPVSALQPFTQYGADAIQELFQLYSPMIEYAQGAKFKCALTLFLVTWALNASPPRPQQLYKMRFDRFGMLVPSVVGSFHQFKQVEEAVNSSGLVRKGLASPSLASVIFNPDDIMELFIRAAQSSFEHYFPFTYPLLVAMLDSEIQAAGSRNSDFDLVQGDRASRAQHLQRYLTEIKKLHQVLFGFANPADDPNKIIKTYSLLSFHVITWNIAFARGDLRLLHNNFVGRYQLHDMLPLCIASEPHRTVVFQDGLKFLNYRCLECFRAGGCNTWCPYCPNVCGPTAAKSFTPSANPMLPPEHVAAYKVDKKKFGKSVSVATWAAAQKPPVKLIAAVSSATNPPSLPAKSYLARAVLQQNLVYEHPPVLADF